MPIRIATSADRDAIVALIDSVYREYGDQVVLDKVDRDLLDVEASFGPGNFAVFEDEAGVRGTIALIKRGDTPLVYELKRLYVHPDLRGTGVAKDLVDWVFSRARELGAARIDFWSDTRFARAHRFYEKLGFHQTGDVRHLDDGWAPYSEYGYTVELSR